MYTTVNNNLNKKSKTMRNKASTRKLTKLTVLLLHGAELVRH